MAEQSRKKGISWKKRKKAPRARATVRWREARKLFRYETHRAAYRVKGANLKKPLPRLSAPRCGGIKIQKEESPTRGLERHRKEKGGKRKKGVRVQKGGLTEVHGIGKLLRNLSRRRFELFLSDRAPSTPRFYLSSFSSHSNKKEIIGGGDSCKNRSAEMRKTAWGA